MAKPRFSFRLILRIGSILSAVLGIVAAIIWAKTPPAVDHWKEVARAEAYLKQGRPDLAFKSVSEIRDEAPGSAEALTLAAQALLMRGEISVAKRTLQRSLKMKEEQPEALKMLAAIYLAYGDGPRGITLLKQASRLSPRDFRPWFALGKVHHDMGDLDKAAEAYKQASRRAPPEKEARESYTGRIRALVEKNRVEEADIDLVEALRRWPKDPSLLGLSARVARGAGRIDEALEKAEKTLVIDPENFDAMLVRAQLNHASGKTELAIADLKHAILVKPNDIGALQLLLQAQTRLGFKEEAAETETKFRKTTERLALMDSLTREITNKPDDPEPRWRMGRAAAEGGMWTLAYHCYQAAIDLDPKFEPARASLEELRAGGKIPSEILATFPSAGANSRASKP